jgi:hypothetical protein
VSQRVPPDELRLGTWERDAVAAILADHFVAGRLDCAEYQQRLDAALLARTRGHLRPLFRDLPPNSRPSMTPVPDGSGHLSDRLHAELAADGLLILDEDLAGTMIYQRYRTSGQYIEYSRDPVFGTVAVSVRRLVVWAGNAKRVDATFGTRFRAALAFDVDDGHLLINADVRATTGPASTSTATRVTTRRE